MKTQCQVKQRSGVQYKISLDDDSIEALRAAQEEHKQRGSKFSQGVIARRAFRVYAQYLQHHCNNYQLELQAIKRAAKGVS
jgi:hypothetical protein